MNRSLGPASPSPFKWRYSDPFPDGLSKRFQRGRSAPVCRGRLCRAGRKGLRPQGGQSECAPPGRAWEPTVWDKWVTWAYRTSSFPPDNSRRCCPCQPSRICAKRRTSLPWCSPGQGFSVSPVPRRLKRNRPLATLRFATVDVQHVAGEPMRARLGERDQRLSDVLGSRQTMRRVFA